MREGETSVNTEIIWLSSSKQVHSALNISTDSLNIEKLKEKWLTGKNIMKTLMGYVPYWAITAQQERRYSPRKGQNQITAICSQP